MGRLPVLLEGTHVDDEAVFHVLLQHALEGFVDFLDGDDFDFRDDVVLAAVVEHLLGFFHAADHGAGDGAAAGDEVEGREGGRLFGQLREHGGSSDPLEERRLEFALRIEQDRWIATTKKYAQESFDQAGAMLRKAGVTEAAVQVLFCEPGEPQETADELLKMANGCQFRTVVVGRRSVSWLHELFSQDISEELLRRAKGFCIWVVE